MNELRNSKSDDQLEELLLLTEQMQEELDQKDRTIEKLKMQIDESLTLNEKLNSENKTENIQALKNDLRKTVNVNILLYKKWKIFLYNYRCYASAS